MHGAEMMPGVANFLMSCNVRNHKVFIVSHKTEYGHFDPEMISLRSEVLKWMKTKFFFNPQYFGIRKENVFFADTREEKVKKIGSLKCDWFIDDLPEVFEERDFPSETKKALFGDNGSNILNDMVFAGNWRKISEKILGQITDKDIVSWLNLLTKIPIEKLQKILNLTKKYFFMVWILLKVRQTIMKITTFLKRARSLLEKKLLKIN